MNMPWRRYIAKDKFPKNTNGACAKKRWREGEQRIEKTRITAPNDAIARSVSSITI